MKKVFSFLLFCCCYLASFSQSTVYFPPLSSASVWETTSPSSLGWSTSKIDTLFNFLEKENTKAFVVLKDGKIVLEKYFGTFTVDSIWYWASAGKTITSFLIGKAQEEGFLNINDRSGKYLGAGWTSSTPDQENAITIRNQITMTTGLDDGVDDNHCTLPACLKFKSNSGTRWAYHNAPYTLLEKVLENATSTSVNLYTSSKLKSKTGMTGIWAMINSDNVYFSTARSMARFGLLMQKKCIWKTDTLLNDTAYYRAMINTSQDLNKSYGYLWWLNGKSSYMLPTLQYNFQGSYAPEAPEDMFAGLGKNGQIVSISPSNGLVIVRMGNAPTSSSSEIPNQFCNLIWQKLNDVIYNRTSIESVDSEMNDVQIFANQSGNTMTLKFDGKCDRLVVLDSLGRIVQINLAPKSPFQFDVSKFPKGIYFVRLKSGQHFLKQSFLKK